MSQIADPSYLLFVYPFLFAPDTFTHRAQSLQAAHWQAGRHKHLVWTKDKFPDDDMLAYVAEHLRPDAATATARLWKMNWQQRDYFGLSGCADWRLQRPKGAALPFVWGNGDKSKESGGAFAFRLALFHTGVGFLTACVTPQTRELDDWLDFLHYFRFTKGQRGTKLEATSEVIANAAPIPFFPAVARSRPDGTGLYRDLLAALLNTARLENDQPEWWREVFVPGQVLPFSVIYVDGQDPQQDLGVAYKIRNCFNTQQGANPAPTDLQPDHPGLLEYAARCWHIFSLDGGSFLAADAPATPFFRQTMPGHLRDQYFLLYLLALHQRFLLMELSNQVAGQWLAPGPADLFVAERAPAFARIRARLLDFTARDYFTQVMQREHHHRCYRRWQELFQVRELYDEVRQEVREMHDILQTQHAAQLQLLAAARERQEAERETAAKERAEAEAEAQAKHARQREQAEQARANKLNYYLAAFSVLFGVPALILSFLGVNLIGWTTKNEGLLWWKVLLYVVAGWLAGFVVLIIIRRVTARGENET